MIEITDHPLLDLRTVEAELPKALGELASPPWLTELLSSRAVAPLASDDRTRTAIRDLLRHGGYKPTGRGKPASEYLLRAATEGGLSSINPVVDAGNVVSLHSGLPLSVVDLDRAAPPLSVRLGAAGARYVFNSAGQEIDVEGLLCLHDAAGPCANGVKDAMRTKTTGDTRRTLTIVWSSRALPDRGSAATAWLAEILTRLGLVVAL